MRIKLWWMHAVIVRLVMTDPKFIIFAIGRKKKSFTALFSLIFPTCSVKTDLMEIGANSTLLVAKVNTTDAGNYTCSIGESQQYTVLVHVLNGKIKLTFMLLSHSSKPEIQFYIVQHF